jgi:gliding motility-associated-like protein
MKPVILSVLLLIFTVTTFAQTNYPNGVSGNLARWNFTNGGTVTSLSDVSGNSNNSSSVSNLVTANGFRNLTNKATHFNGTSSYAIVPHKAALNPAQITIVAVVKPTGFYSGNCQGNNIIYKCYDYYTKSGCWAMYIHDDDGNCGSFSPNNEKLDFAGPSAVSYTLPSGNTIPVNSWYFLVLTYDGNQLKRYQLPMDTLTYYSTISPISTTTMGYTLGSNTYDVRIGGTQNPPFPYWFNGDMDEIALFNKVLTPTEIQSVYHYLWGQLDISVADTIFCPNDTLDVNYTYYNPDLFQTGNVFKAELSNASGSFVSPVIIGTLTSTNMTGTIKCTLPSALPGNGYRIRIEATNAHFISGDNGKNIRINPPAKPVAASNTPVCSGNNLLLTATTTTGGVSYSWAGPNSFSSATQNPSIGNVQTSASGNYIVTVTLGPCSSKDTETVVINPLPAKPVAASNSPLCSGTTLSLSATSGTSGVSYSWTGPNSYTSSVQSPSITNAAVNASGDYVVTVTTGNGCSAKDTETVVVNLTPVKPVATSNTPLCSGNNINLSSATSTSGVSYSWTGPNSFSSATQNAVVNNAGVIASGNYIVTVTLGLCSSADTEAVLVNLTPVKPVATSNSPLCSGNTLSLSATTTTSGISYSWTGPNSFAATIQNNLIINPPVSSSGNYIVTVSLNGCSSKDTEAVVVNLSPAKPVASSNTPVCTGGNINLTAVTTTPGISYNWTGPGGFASTAQNPSIVNVSSSASGKYIVTVTLGPCTSADTATVTVIPPVTSPAGGSNSPICERDTLFLDAISTIPGVSYSWTGPNGFGSSAQNPFISNTSLAAAGTYYVSAVLNGCPSPPAGTVVTIKAPPAVPKASSNSPVCEGDTLLLYANNIASGVAPLWYGPAGFTASYKNPVIPHVKPSQGGLYTLSAIKDACSSLPDSILVIVKPLNKSSFELNDNACLGERTELRPYYDVATLSSYSWFFGGPSTLDSTIYQTYYLSWTTIGKKTVRLTVVANNGCVSVPYEHIIDVHENPDARIEYVSDKDICTMDDITLRATENKNFTYTWTPEGYFTIRNQSEVHAVVPHSGYIFLNVKNEWDCAINDSVLINARNCCTVSLPDAFTPNGDGRNDKFRIITNGNQEISKFIVVNRWGEVVFETTNQGEGWDGTFKGKPVEIGTYFYYLRYNCNDEKDIERKGDLILMR